MPFKRVYYRNTLVTDDGRFVVVRGWYYKYAPYAGGKCKQFTY